MYSAQHFFEQVFAPPLFTRDGFNFNFLPQTTQVISICLFRVLFFPLFHLRKHSWQQK
jgi:hypothetical protein